MAKIGLSKPQPHKEEKKMADFDKAFEVTMGHEGGYVHDPDDPGGETYKGVARDRHPTWRGWGVIDKKKSEPNFPKNLDGDEDLQECIKEFYKLSFWDRIRGDEISDDDIATELFDTAVNMGVYWASMFLQQTLNLLNKEQRLYSDISEDGAIGRNTLKSLNTLLSYDPPELVLLWLNVFQGCRYSSISKNNPKLEKYMRGWSKRLKVTKQYG
jgi:lysozyme family protein